MRQKPIAKSSLDLLVDLMFESSSSFEMLEPLVM